MGTPKGEVRKLLDHLPEDSSFEDIQHHVYVQEMIERRLKDFEEGRVLSQEEAERRMEKWLGQSPGRTAADDLDGIAGYIARDSPNHAAAVV